jgi:hypothetical protein
LAVAAANMFVTALHPRMRDAGVGRHQAEGAGLEWHAAAAPGAQPRPRHSLSCTQLLPRCCCATPAPARLSPLVPRCAAPLRLVLPVRLTRPAAPSPHAHLFPAPWHESNSGGAQCGGAAGRAHSCLGAPGLGQGRPRRWVAGQQLPLPLGASAAATQHHTQQPRHCTPSSPAWRHACPGLPTPCPEPESSPSRPARPLPASAPPAPRRSNIIRGLRQPQAPSWATSGPPRPASG